MATFTINTPYRDLKTIGATEKGILQNYANKTLNAYKAIIDECASNSGIPSLLLLAYIVNASNGVNNSAFRKSDKLVRSGVCSLSQKTAKIILCNEKARNALSEAEISYLTSADGNIGAYLNDADKAHRGYSFDWRDDYNAGVNQISDTKNPFLLSDAKVSIGITAIWLGQLWDVFSKQTDKIVDKVLITSLLPYNGWLGGNDFCKAKSWSIDWTKTAYFDKLPKPANKEATTNIINPNGGSIGSVLRNSLAQDGILDVYKSII